ncbi:hypothetical protein BJ138DRAFT_1011266 [Hygrophoropsis aurantiaca]|uniref:Uncharacterized protein n=1 Tax=Hygrophoropsis aurantiaca TaxID=72124 RepID=A0ACB8A834_9AGAM|nr:hypothetical protein BJ138DRAFT_1011266 [Hygrophoropsis aurantiaca]
MKSFVFASIFFGIAFGQNIMIAAPLQGTRVSPGSNIVVDIQRPNSLSSSEEVAVVIAIQSCATSPCIPPTKSLGMILYNGHFNPQEPQLSSPNAGFQQPGQNFTIQIPPSLRNGSALITITHLALIGAGPIPWLEYQNVSLVVV